MKVIVSTDAIRYPLTGIGRYTFELINELQHLDLADELLFFKQLMVQKNISPVMANPSSGQGMISFLKRSNLLVDTISTLYPLAQGLALRKYKDYIYHSTAYYLPALHTKSIATFHDISTFTCPEFHPEARIRYMSKQLMLSMKRASYIVTVSEFTKNELIKYCNYPEKKIRVTPLACGKEFHPREITCVQPFLKKIGIKWNKFTLYIGSIEPRKNIESLLDAYEILPLHIRLEYPLVLSGFHGWKSENLHNRFDKATREGWLKYLGFISQDDLPLLYSAARVFTFPSHYEGFGLPVLEAMASGVPVVCSNAASLPEIAGDAALQCEPGDVDLLSINIQKALLDESWREYAIARGFARVGYFSWSRCAKETMSVYELLQD